MAQDKKKKKKEEKKQLYVVRAVNTVGRNITGNSQNPKMQSDKRFLSEAELAAYRSRKKSPPDKEATKDKKKKKK